MGKIRNSEEGNFPAPNTRIKFLKNKDADYSGGINKGDIVYVCSHPATKSGGIVVDKSPDQYHGFFCTEWEELTPRVVDTLSDKKKKKLAKEALQTAKDLGYCNEATRVLSALGFPVPESKTVTVEVWDGDLLEVTVNGKPVEV